MVKKIVAAIVAVLVLLAVAAVVWARSILATETVRTAIAAQASRAMSLSRKFKVLLLQIGNEPYYFTILYRYCQYIYLCY